MSQRKNYTREFKLEAVRLSETSAKPVAQIERELGLSRNQLVKWRSAYRQQQEDAFVGKGHQTDPEAELRRLRRELEHKRQELEVLKKALIFFAKEQP